MESREGFELVEETKYNDALCRICLDETNTELHRVCLCKSLVHLSCLSQWQSTKAKKLYLPFNLNQYNALNACEVCHGQYKYPERHDIKNSVAYIQGKDELVKTFRSKVLQDFGVITVLLLLSYCIVGFVFLSPDVFVLKIEDSETCSASCVYGYKFFNGLLYTHFLLGIAYVMMCIVCCIASRESGGNHVICCNFAGSDCNCDCDNDVKCVLLWILIVIGIVGTMYLVYIESYLKRSQQYDVQEAALCIQLIQQAE